MMGNMTPYMTVKQLHSIKRRPIDHESKDTESTHPNARNVIVSKSRWPIELFVHIIPMTAVIVIIAINLRGYFVGTQFIGVSDSTSQSIALSALQVTAKLLEVTVITSLGYLILDIVQHFLLFDEAGLPLALTGIRLSFSNLFFLLSPAFWSGIRAFHSYKTRILVTFLLLSCGLIATFIGPAAALLLIPATRSDWLASNLLFQVPPDQQPLWEFPLWVNGSSGNDSICLRPPEHAVDNPSPAYYSCMWKNTIYAGTCMDPSATTTSFTETLSTYTRQLSFASYDGSKQHRPRSWAWSGTSTADCIAGSLFKDWTNALDKPFDTKNAYNAALSTLSQYNRYIFRDQYSTQAKLQGALASAVRASCLGSMRSYQNPDPYPFPVLPLNGNFIQDTNATYMIPADIVRNISEVRSFWISPKSPPEVQDIGSDTEYATHLPSAFLITQFPNATTNSSTSGLVVTCSIDARWINATQTISWRLIHGTYFPTVSGDIGNDTFDSHGRPIADKLSPRIALNGSWLEQLTPTLNHTISGTNVTQISPGYNSFSRVLNHFVKFNDGAEDVTQRLESFLSFLTVAGLTHHNSSSCNRTISSLKPFGSQTPLASVNSTGFDPTLFLTSGGQSTSLQQDPSSLSRSEFLWTGTISGYAYTVDSTAYILAVIVLFSYIVLAVCHICFMIYKRWYSEIWWSIPDIVALAHHSPPSAFFENTSGGTDLGSSNKLLMRLRVPDQFDGDDETIHLLVDSPQRSSNRGNIKGYHKLQKGKKY